MDLSPPTWAGKTPRSRGVWAAALGALALAIALAFALLHPWTRAVPTPAPEKLTIALSSTPHAGLLHLAAAKGFFAAAGLDVTLVPVSHGKAAMGLLAERKTDMAAAAEVPFVIAVLNGEPFAIAATIVSVSTEM